MVSITTKTKPSLRFAEAWHPRLRKDRTSLSRLQRAEKTFELVVRKHLLDYMKLVNTHLEALSLQDESEAETLLRSADNDFNLDAFAKAVKNEYSRPLTLGAVFGAKDLPKGALFAETLDLEGLLLRVDWSLLDPEVIEWLDNEADNLVTGLIDTTKARVVSQIKQGIKAGDSRNLIADRVKDVASEITSWRARQIAQTEVIRAHSQGALQVYKASGVVQGKRWVDGQENACPLCRGLNGQVVDLEDSFQGIDAPPAHTGCRCTIAATLRK